MKIKLVKLDMETLTKLLKGDAPEELQQVGKENMQSFMEEFSANAEKAMHEGCGEPDCDACNAKASGDDLRKHTEWALNVLDKEELIQLVLKLTSNMHAMYYGFNSPHDMIVEAGVKDAWDRSKDRNPQFKAAMDSFKADGDKEAKH